MQNVLLGLATIAVLGGIGYVLMTGTGDAPELAVDELPMTDSVTTDQAMESDTAQPAMVESVEPATPNIVETAVAAGDFTTLVTAVNAAELAPVLTSDGPFTVFAPTDAAFATLPDGTLDTLLMPSNQSDLANILTYHVVPGAVSASDLSDGMTVETVSGETITFAVDAAGEVMVNDATVVSADIEASNGIIHVVDTVLLPPSE